MSFERTRRPKPTRSAPFDVADATFSDSLADALQCASPRVGKHGNRTRFRRRVADDLVGNGGDRDAQAWVCIAYDTLETRTSEKEAPIDTSESVRTPSVSPVSGK